MKAAPSVGRERPLVNQAPQPRARLGEKRSRLKEKKLLLVFLLKCKARRARRVGKREWGDGRPESNQTRLWAWKQSQVLPRVGRKTLTALLQAGARRSPADAAARTQEVEVKPKTYSHWSAPDQ